MKDRLLTLACAIGALALFYAFFAPKPRLEDNLASHPTTQEHRANGYLGAATWLERAGVPVTRLRRRFDELAALPGVPKRGNLLITTLPYRFGLRDREIVPLLDWVSEGNTVLLMASLGDTPEWAFGYDRSLRDTLESLTEVRFDSVEWSPEDLKELARRKQLPGSRAGESITYDGRLAKPRRMKVVPNREHPILDGVAEITAETEYPALAHWRAEPGSAFAFTLAHEDSTDSEALWIRRRGMGSIITSAYGSLFTNELIGEHDNARLLANIAAYSLRAGGAVIFDDAHQGLTELYDPEAFFGDSRLHATIWLLLALWLIWVIGMTRLRPAAQSAPVPRESSLIIAIGGYLARVLRPSQAGTRLCELFFNDIHRRLGQAEDGTPTWDWLARQPQVVAADVAQLREYHARLAAGTRVDLSGLNDLTVRLQERLQ